MLFVPLYSPKSFAAIIVSGEAQETHTMQHSRRTGNVLLFGVVFGLSGLLRRAPSLIVDIWGCDRRRVRLSASRLDLETRFDSGGAKQAWCVTGLRARCVYFAAQLGNRGRGSRGRALRRVLDIQQEA